MFDLLAVLRIGYLPIYFQLLFSLARFCDTLEKVVAPRNESRLRYFQIFGNQLGRFPERLVFRRFWVQTRIGACGFNHRSQRLVRVTEQSLGVGFLSGWLIVGTFCDGREHLAWFHRACHSKKTERKAEQETTSLFILAVSLISRKKRVNHQ